MKKSFLIALTALVFFGCTKIDVDTFVGTWYCEEMGETLIVSENTEYSSYGGFIFDGSMYRYIFVLQRKTSGIIVSNAYAQLSIDTEYQPVTDNENNLLENYGKIKVRGSKMEISLSDKG
jgi:hypothetical protein